MRIDNASENEQIFNLAELRELLNPRVFRQLVIVAAIAVLYACAPAPEPAVPLQPDEVQLTLRMLEGAYSVDSDQLDASNSVYIIFPEEGTKRVTPNQQQRVAFGSEMPPEDAIFALDQVTNTCRKILATTNAVTIACKPLPTEVQANN